MARLEEIDKDLDENGVVLAKDIDDCSNCPLYESECHGLTSDGAGNPIEPPCTSLRTISKKCFTVCDQKTGIL